MSQEYQDFLDKQEGIYNKFRGSDIREVGITPTVKDQGGYLVGLRHSADITGLLEEFANRIAQTVPAISYDAETVHTTISDYKLSDEFTPDTDILDQLAASVRKINIARTPLIGYEEWIYNSNTIIVAGRPDEGFLEVAKQVIGNAKKDEIDLRLPWGAHMTAARFTESRTPAELEEFFALMEKAPVLGNSRPTAIEVGHFQMTTRDFTVTTHERFAMDALLKSPTHHAV